MSCPTKGNSNTIELTVNMTYKYLPKHYKQLLAFSSQCVL